MAYTTRNNLGKLLNLKLQNTKQPDKYDKSGAYQLKCPMCHKRYIGQTGRPFRVRFREHYNDYKYTYNNSKFDQHVLNEDRAFGPMNHIMDIVHFTKKMKNVR